MRSALFYTVTNLACFSQFVSEVLDCQGQVDVVYNDFQMAFDRIDHYILLAKLEWYGFIHSLICLFRSYSIGKENRVCYANFGSKLYSLNSGLSRDPILVHSYVLFYPSH